MRRAILVAAMAAAAAQAAVIRGTVVENYTGKLLTRALVTLVPLEPTPASVRSMRTTRFGAFEFDGLPAGAYLVKASRRGFIPAEYGQKRWNSAGTAIAMEESATAFLTIRLPRYSAIGGTVVDENDIGLPDYPVTVYRATQPPEVIRDGVTDDRGMYRVGGLDPGKYFVRTSGKQYDDGSYLPTFSKETTRAEEAQSAEVYLEQQTNRIDVRPIPGKLFTLSVGVLTAPEVPEEFITLTFASEMGRTTMKKAAARFGGLPPGTYEVYAEAPCVPCNGATIQAGYMRVNLARDSSIQLQLMPMQESSVMITGGPSDGGGKILMRRKDMAGVGPVYELGVSRNRATLLPGRWEVMLDPPAGYYVTGYSAPGLYRRDPFPAHGWKEISNTGYGYLRFQLTGGPGAIHGVVKESPYAPVYLEPYDPGVRRRLAELKATRADARGQFRFGELAPGTYRLLATYEYLDPETETIDTGSPASVTIEAHGDAVKELELWVIR